MLQLKKQGQTLHTEVDPYFYGCNIVTAFYFSSCNTVCGSWLAWFSIVLLEKFLKIFVGLAEMGMPLNARGLTRD